MILSSELKSMAIAFSTINYHATAEECLRLSEEAANLEQKINELETENAGLKALVEHLQEKEHAE